MKQRSFVGLTGKTLGTAGASVLLATLDAEHSKQLFLLSAASGLSCVHNQVADGGNAAVSGRAQ